MGGTITNHPGSYLKIISDIKAAWTSPAKLRTGVTFFPAYTTGTINRLPGGKHSPSTGRPTKTIWAFNPAFNELQVTCNT